MNRRHLLFSSLASISACGIPTLQKPFFEDADFKQTVVPARPDQGFNFPYILQLPSQRVKTALPYLLVESNNSGPISEEVGPHLEPTSELARQGLGGRVSLTLGLPLLMPVFPRGPSLYTHSLGRSTLVTQATLLKRLDFQLLAMVKDAQRLLNESGRDLHRKVLLTGFSASAMFATRFAALHPQEVAALVAGGLNGFVILPIPRLMDHWLPYPLGIFDIKQVAGDNFDGQSWHQVPQFLFMGALDINDAVEFEDSYSPEDRLTIHQLLGKQMIPNRWNACERIYRAAMAPARFKTYPKIGHGTNGAIHREAAAFFLEVTAA